MCEFVSGRFRMCVDRQTNLSVFSRVHGVSRPHNRLISDKKSLIRLILDQILPKVHDDYFNVS